MNKIKQTLNFVFQKIKEFYKSFNQHQSKIKQKLLELFSFILAKSFSIVQFYYSKAKKFCVRILTQIIFFWSERLSRRLRILPYKSRYYFWIFAFRIYFLWRKTFEFSRQQIKFLQREFFIWQKVLWFYWRRLFNYLTFQLQKIKFPQLPFRFIYFRLAGFGNFSFPLLVKRNVFRLFQVIKEPIHKHKTPLLTTLISAIIVVILSVFLSSLPSTKADTDIIRPSANFGTMQWTASGSASHFENIDEVVIQPTTGDDSDSNFATNQNQFEEFEMTTISGVATATQVVVWVYVKTVTNDGLDINLEGNSTTSAVSISPSTSFTWLSATFSSLSLSQTDVTALRVKFKSTKSGPADETHVATMYAEVTFTTASVDPVLDQESFRWYDNVDGEATTTAKAAENATTTDIALNDVLQLRMNIEITTATLSTSSTFKLQFATSTSGTWTDVGATGSAVIWRASDNASITDGTTLASTTLASTTVAATYEEDNPSAGTPNEAGINDFIEWDFIIEHNGASSSATYYFRMINGNDTALDTYTRYPALTTLGPKFTQSVYRWFDNPDNATPSAVLADEDATATNITTGQKLRLRVLLHTASASAGAGDGSFKLQFAQKVGGTCNDDESWTDVSGATDIGFFNNASLTDGATVVSTSSDPSHGADATILERYVESNPFDNVNAININEDGLWDISLVNSSATLGTSYCFKIINSSDNSDINGYDVFPELTTASVNFNQSAYRWFDNLDSLAPGSPKADQDATISNIASGDDLRLRVLVHVASSSLATTSQSFKLKYAAKAGGSCGGGDESYADVGATSSATIWRFKDLGGVANNNDTPTATSSDPTHSSDTVLLERYIEINTFNNRTTINTSEDGLWDFAIENNAAAAGTNYCFKLTKDNDSDLDGYTVFPELTTTGTGFNQNIYRFYVNEDALNPTDPWPVGGTNLATNTPITENDSPPGDAEKVRIRLSLNIASSPFATSSQAFKLQFGEKITTCSAASFSDVGATSSSVIWRSFDNSTTSDGATLPSAILDASNVVETYEETNNSASNPNGASVGQNIEYDWVIENNSATSSTTFCFQMVKDDGSVLNYAIYPEITTPSPTFDQQNFRWYANGDAITPTSSLAVLNATSTDIRNSQTIRLRIDVEVGTINLATSSQAFKLQYSTSTSGSWTDAGGSGSSEIWRGFDNSSVAGTITISSVLLISTNTPETYEEFNNSTSNPTAVNVGQRGEWDWALENNSASSSQNYYFRMVKSSGTTFGTYTRYPALTTSMAPNATSFTNSTEGSLSDGGRISQSITVAGTDFGAGPCDGANFSVKIGTFNVPCSDVSSWSATSITFTVSTSINVFGGSGSSGLTVHANSYDDATPLTFFVYPDITSLTTPSISNAAREGENITLNGSRFNSSDSTVTILSQSAGIVSWTDTAVEVTVPTSISDSTYSGNIVLTRSGDSKTDTFSGFEILPSLASISPSSGQVGINATLSGDHLCQTGTCPAAGERQTSTTSVTFTSGVEVVDADITAWTDTSVGLTVPGGAQAGNVTVKSNSRVSNGVTFTVTTADDEIPTSSITVSGSGGSVSESSIESTTLTKSETQIQIKEISNQIEELNRTLSSLESRVLEVEDLIEEEIAALPLVPPEAPSIVIEPLPVSKVVELLPKIVFETIRDSFVNVNRRFTTTIRNLVFGFRKIFVRAPEKTKEAEPSAPTLPEAPELVALPSLVLEPQPTIPPPLTIAPETVVVKTTAGNVTLARGDDQLRVIAGHNIKLFVRPARPVISIEGTMLFEKNETGFWMPIINKANAQLKAQAKEFLVASFKYQDDDQDGIYEAEISLPPVEGRYILKTDINYQDGESKSIETITLIDPEGYVFEKLPWGELRIKDAKVTLWWFNGSSFEPWRAKIYDQQNPQITDKTGEYSFLVSAGRYYLTVESENYKPYRSEEFEVSEAAPIHLNIELKYTGILRNLLKFLF